MTRPAILLLVAFLAPHALGQASTSESEAPAIPIPQEWDTSYAVLIGVGEGFSGTGEERQAIIRSHHQYQLGLLADGTATVGGPFVMQQGDAVAGLTIVRAGSLEEAELIAKSDPAVEAGILTVTVRPWTTPSHRPSRFPAGDPEEVIRVIEAFFHAMTARDVEASRRVMVDEGQFFTMRDLPDNPTLQRIAHERYLEMLGQSEGELVERFWEPTVLVEGDVALVWTPYDIYRDDEFMHCGVDGFMMLRTNEGWQIASVIYTTEPEGCPDSPLGPLGEGPTVDPTLLPASARAAQVSPATRHQILAVVHEMLNAMADRDVETSRRLMLEQGQGVSTTLGHDGYRVNVQTNTAYFDWLAETRVELREHIWDEVVLVHGPIANVWTPYRFYVDGEFSHCGVNLVSLVKLDEGWRIADWVYDVRPDGCPTGPAGEGR